MTLIPSIRQRRNTIDEDHWRAAVHEAAHGIIGRILYFRCGDIVARRDGSGSSQTLAADFRAPSRAIDCAQLVVCAAGPEAEALFFGDSLGHQGDLRKIDSIIQRIGQDGDRQDIFVVARKRAGALVRQHAKYISRVATELLDRGRLTDSEVRRLMG